MVGVGVLAPHDADVIAHHAVRVLGAHIHNVGVGARGVVVGDEGGAAAAAAGLGAVPHADRVSSAGALSGVLDVARVGAAVEAGGVVELAAGVGQAVGGAHAVAVVAAGLVVVGALGVGAARSLDGDGTAVNAARAGRRVPVAAGDGVAGVGLSGGELTLCDATRAEGVPLAEIVVGNADGLGANRLAGRDAGAGDGVHRAVLVRGAARGIGQVLRVAALNARLAVEAALAVGGALLRGEVGAVAGAAAGRLVPRAGGGGGEAGHVGELLHAALNALVLVPQARRVGGAHSGASRRVAAGAARIGDEVPEAVGVGGALLAASVLVLALLRAAVGGEGALRALRAVSGVARLAAGLALVGGSGVHAVRVVVAAVRGAVEEGAPLAANHVALLGRDPAAASVGSAHVLCQKVRAAHGARHGGLVPAADADGRARRDAGLLEAGVHADAVGAVPVAEAVGAARRLLGVDVAAAETACVVGVPDTHGVGRAVAAESVEEAVLLADTLRAPDAERVVVTLLAGVEASGAGDGALLAKAVPHALAVEETGGLLELAARLGARAVDPIAVGVVIAGRRALVLVLAESLAPARGGAPHAHGVDDARGHLRLQVAVGGAAEGGGVPDAVLVGIAREGGHVAVLAALLAHLANHGGGAVEDAHCAIRAAAREGALAGGGDGEVADGAAGADA